MGSITRVGDKMASAIWKFAVVLIFLLMAAFAALDYDLFRLFGAVGTITDWLRENPWWAIVPLALMQAFLIWLCGHLWLGWYP